MVGDIFCLYSVCNFVSAHTPNMVIVDSFFGVLVVFGGLVAVCETSV